jgi:hypothetical protein
MKNKTKFTIWFLLSNLLLWLFLLILQKSGFIAISDDKMNFILLGDLIAVCVSLALIFPMLQSQIDGFVLQYIILITCQMLFMLGFVLYEIYQWKTNLNYPIFIQLIPFSGLIIIQSILLYNYSKNR